MSDEQPVCDLDDNVLEDQLVKWIDTNVIAQAIIDHVRDELGETPTFDNCKECWLRELGALLN